MSLGWVCLFVPLRPYLRHRWMVRSAVGHLFQRQNHSVKIDYQKRPDGKCRHQMPQRFPDSSCFHERNRLCSPNSCLAMAAGNPQPSLLKPIQTAFVLLENRIAFLSKLGISGNGLGVCMQAVAGDHLIDIKGLYPLDKAKSEPKLIIHYKVQIFAEWAHFSMQFR